MDYLNVRDDGTERITLRKNVKTRDYLFVTEALEERGERGGNSTAGDYFSSRNFQMDCISVELYGGASVLCRMRTGNTG